jgi:uncharacterized membrane protein YfcA
MDPDVMVLAALVLTAFVAGYVDAVAGGGGLLTVPALLLAGLPPAEAVATNKLQGTFGVAIASYAFWRAGHLDLRSLRWPIAGAALGAGFGSAMVSVADPGWLETAAPLALVLVAGYFALAPSLDRPRVARAASPLALAALLAFPVGTYDGFLGPGAGSFYMAGFVMLAGPSLIEATASTKVLNATSNAVALLVFLGGGKVVFMYGLPMALGQIAGAQLGAACTLRFGSAIIRPLVIAVSVLMALRLIAAQFGAFSG